MTDVLVLREDDPVAAALAAAIRSGDLAGLQRLLADDARLVHARLENRKGIARTALHVAADWPGHFPNGPSIVAALVAAGADPNARIVEAPHAETPLHWAASSDDVEVAEALIAAGADLEAMGASIVGGTPLDDAVGYGCWQVARLLVARGARARGLWQAAGLGMTAEIASRLEAADRPTPEQVNQAFWHACDGGQRRAAEYLLDRGADPEWMPSYNRRPAMDVAASADGRRDGLVAWLRERREGAAAEAGGKRLGGD
jgi:hypothetical protein